MLQISYLTLDFILCLYQTNSIIFPIFQSDLFVLADESSKDFVPFISKRKILDIDMNYLNVSESNEVINKTDKKLAQKESNNVQVVRPRADSDDFLNIKGTVCFFNTKTFEMFYYFVTLL